MLDRLSGGEKAVAILSGIIVPLGLIVGAAVSYGDMRSDVDTLQEQTMSIQNELIELQKPESPKAALCLKLTEELGKAYANGVGSTVQSEEVVKQLQAMGCYDRDPR